MAKIIKVNLPTSDYSVEGARRSNGERVNCDRVVDKFIRDVSAGLRPGTSALFLMSSEGNAEKLLPGLKVHHGRLLSTTLPPDQEKALRDAIEK